MRYDAVLFDLDGTLLDTLEDLADSMYAVLEQAGCPTHPLDSYKYFVGRGLQALVHDALPPEKRDPPSVERSVRAMEVEYASRWDNKTHPYDGIPELLDALAERGLPLAVLSNKPDKPTQLAVGKFLSSWRFAHVTGARPSVPRKPDPTAALTIAEEMNIPPERFLYLGDTAVDMETARSAGMHPIGALWGFRTADELTGAGAVKLIGHPGELLDLLDH